MLEIERKYLIKSDKYKELYFEKETIKQGYLNTDIKRTVRVRIKNNEAFLTIKGKASDDGLSKFEWEKEIPLEEGLELYKLCESGSIEKTRYLIKNGKYTIEVDEFGGLNEGLVIAEIELNSINDVVDVPEWFSEEITDDMRYTNSNLSKEPYQKWLNN